MHGHHKAVVPHAVSRRGWHAGRRPSSRFAFGAAFLDALSVLVFLAMVGLLLAEMASWSDLGSPAPAQLGPASSIVRTPDVVSSRSVFRPPLGFPWSASTRSQSRQGAIPAVLSWPSGPSRAAVSGIASPRPAPATVQTSPSARQSRSVAAEGPDVQAARGTRTSGPTAKLRAAIAWCESRNKPTVVNPASGASGLYQFLDSTWRAVTGRTDKASDATPAEQRAAFDALYAVAGTSPWSSSAWCWKARLS
jgi:hypothetical protein